MTYNREFAPVGFIDFRALVDDAWTDFTATSPVGIDLIAEASLRSMIAARLRQAAKAGETDRAALKALALRVFRTRKPRLPSFVMRLCGSWSPDLRWRGYPHVKFGLGHSGSPARLRPWTKCKRSSSFCQRSIIRTLEMVIAGSVVRRAWISCCASEARPR
jgi:hypothetical protein